MQILLDLGITDLVTHPNTERWPVEVMPLYVLFPFSRDIKPDNILLDEHGKITSIILYTFWFWFSSTNWKAFPRDSRSNWVRKEMINSEESVISVLTEWLGSGKKKMRTSLNQTAWCTVAIPGSARSTFTSLNSATECNPLRSFKALLSNA